MMLMMLSKFIIVVGMRTWTCRICTRCFSAWDNVDPKRDTLLVDGPWILHHLREYGWKMGLDATAKFPEEGHPRPWPDDTR